MGMVEDMRRVENDVYDCLKANGMKISPDSVWWDYELSAIKATTDDKIRFTFFLSDSNIVSNDKKHSFDMTTFKNREKS